VTDDEYLTIVEGAVLSFDLRVFVVEVL